MLKRGWTPRNKDRHTGGAEPGGKKFVPHSSGSYFLMMLQVSIGTPNPCQDQGQADCHQAVKGIGPERAREVEKESFSRRKQFLFNAFSSVAQS